PYQQVQKDCEEVIGELKENTPPWVLACSVECRLQLFEPAAIGGETKPPMPNPQSLGDLESYGHYVRALLSFQEEQFKDAYQSLRLAVPNSANGEKWFHNHRRGKAAAISSRAAPELAADADKMAEKIKRTEKWRAAFEAQKFAMELDTKTA